MQIYQAISHLLNRSGLRQVFGLCGSSNVAWIGYGVENSLIDFSRVRHEETSVAAASGFAKASGRIGVATATLGPGFANTINALAAATYDHVPLILIVGQSPGDRPDGLQDLEQAKITGLLGAGFHDVSHASELESAYWSVFAEATRAGRPQVLSVNTHTFDDEVTLSEALPPPSEMPDPDKDSVAAAVDLLAAAEYPLILGGYGALLSGCETQLRNLAELVGARTATSMNANSMFTGYPHDLGLCGKSSPPIIAEAIYRTDVVLSVGASLNDFTTGAGKLFPGARIIQCEIDADQPFRASAPELGLLGDARACVAALTEEWERRGLGSRSVKAATPTRRQVIDSILDVPLTYSAERGLDVRRVYAYLDETLPADRVVVADSGSAVLSFLATIVRARDGRSWINSQGYGSIGLGLGAGIGAATANPGRPVFVFVGDGGFTMSTHDLDSVRMNDLDLTVFVLNDEKYGSESKYLRKFGLPTDVIHQQMPNTALLARAYGGEGVVVSTESQLRYLTLPRRGLFVVELVLDPLLNARSI